ncbi:MAG: hypothetical protein HYR72_25495 [Deltaproteobacteria bacterium]|nr:hypothetical protein [Deltaproteobacteria bacterium]MBI3388432.1 hypothetical protein [Deltaproteobacteria bacterium]
MHDSIFFERHGIPAVFVASEEFTQAADVQARALGMREVARVFVAHPIQDASDDEMRARADAAVDSILAALEQSATPR